MRSFAAEIFRFMQKSLLFLAVMLLPVLSRAQKNDEYKVAAIGFYNLENLFDTIDSPNTNDIDFTPGGRLLWNTEKYVSKEANMAKVISLLGTELNPDGLALLGVAEVENRKVLEDLVSQEPIKSRNYQIVHYDSPDERGIDCGLLYNPKYFTVLGSRPVTVTLKSPKDTVPDLTRDILYVAGRLDGEPVHVMVCHWPSRSSGIKSGVSLLVKLARGVKFGKDLLNERLVARVGGADKIVVGQLQFFRERLPVGGECVAIFRRAFLLRLGRLLNFLAVFIQPGQEKDLPAQAAPRPARKKSRSYL